MRKSDKSKIPKHVRNKRAKSKRRFLKNKGMKVDAKSIALS